MPIWLDIIPEKTTNIPRPHTRRWLIVLAITMMSGVALTFWSWTTVRTGADFWLTALGLPFCLWGLLFSIRRFAYKAEQVAAQSRNREREILIAREIKRGQRCAWILGYHIQHLSGNKPAALVKTVSKAIPVTEIATPRGAKRAVRYAALTAFQSQLDAEIISATSKLAAYMQAITASLPKEIPCCLMLDCDEDIQQRVEEHLRNELTAKTGRLFRLIEGKGLAAFDAWLDKNWDSPGILAAVAFSLPARPIEGDADAITLLILSNRKATAYPEALCLHRPEKGQEALLTKTLHRALLWAAIKPEALKASWQTGPLLVRGSGWHKACEDNGITFSLSEDHRSIDPVLGYAGRAAPWLAIILASSAFNQYGPQIIAAQSGSDEDDVWVTVINKRDARKEIQGNG